MIRLHYVHEEPCYVVRRPNGLPLSFPVWMTESRAAQIEIVCEPRLTLSTLLDLRHLVTLYLSSLGSADSEGSHNNSVHIPPLQKEVAQQATRELMQWIRALAKAMGAGAGDEQNKR